MHDDHKPPSPTPEGSSEPERPTDETLQELERIFGALSVGGHVAAESQEEKREASPRETPKDDATETEGEDSASRASLPEEAVAMPGAEGAGATPDLDTLVAALDAATPPGAVPETAPKKVDATWRRHVVFLTAGSRYALEMGGVIEVTPVPPITPLPHVPAWLTGVTNLRGEILAVLDFRRLLGHPPAAASDRHRLLVLQASSGNLGAGLIVDRVVGVGAVDPQAIRPPVVASDDPVHPFLLGVTESDDSLLSILDADKLLTSDQLRGFTAASPADLAEPTTLD